MKLRGRLISLSATWVLAGPAYSQNAGLESLVAQSQAAMEGNRWEEALDFNKRVVSRYGQENPFRVYGAQFGTVYYRKGVCEMKLKRWDEAMRSFEICYRDFPNEGKDPGNSYQKLALLKWGEAAMGAEDWELAISRFSKFTDERDRKGDPFPQGAFYINLAVCQYRLGRLAEGNENLEIAIRNKGDFPTPDSGIVAGFQGLVEAAIAKRDEQVLLDFIGKNRGELIIGQEEMKGFSGVFLKLAGDALAAGMQRAAIAVYQFVPDTGDDATEALKLAAMALIHERNGNVRGAFAGYLQIERYFPKAANRENHLYQLIRTASLIGEADLAKEHAGRMLRDFPQSAHLQEIRGAGIEIPETAPAPAAVAPPRQDFVAGVPKTPAFTVAIDFYQGRKYREARDAFAGVASRPGVPEDEKLLAEFYQTECLRKLGDLDGLAKAVSSFGGKAALGVLRSRQLEIDALWEAVRTKNWHHLESLASGRTDQRLPGDQRAQVACCLGLALENTGHPVEALNAYNIAMTSDAGASEEIARDAALNVMRIHLADAEVRQAIATWMTPEEDKLSSGFLKLREAASVATLFELSLGAGTPLPAELKELLKYKGGA
ncbi:MAG: tetratricopeptide repeat protein [Verrucomicrobiota bacterium]